MYGTAQVSGGHIHPAVTLATILTGHMHWTRGALYVAAQVLHLGLCSRVGPWSWRRPQGGC